MIDLYNIGFIFIPTLVFKLVSAACVYVAGKAEESTRKIRDVLNVFLRFT